MNLLPTRQQNQLHLHVIKTETHIPIHPDQIKKKLIKQTMCQSIHYARQSH